MSTLAELDDQIDKIAVRPTRPTSRDLPAMWLSNGFYTLSFPDGSHKTFRIRTELKGTFAGRRTLAILVGPDNTREYENVAFLEDKGFNVWRRHREGKVLDYSAIIWELARGDELDGYELRISKRCQICNRPLTSPESIDAGMGPECSNRKDAK